MRISKRTAVTAVIAGAVLAVPATVAVQAAVSSRTFFYGR
jgi:hypothetical protein